MRLRTRLQDFFAEHAVGWEVFMICLAVLYVALETFGMVESDTAGFNVFEVQDLGINAFFALEFITRLIIAPSRWRHFKTHWLDLIAVYPSLRWVRITRLIYVFRCLRIHRTEGVCNSIDRLEIDIMNFLKLNGLEWMLLGLTGTMFVSSLLYYYYEHPVNPKIVTYWDALYASLVTWTTPGYGEIAPITENGRICGLVLITSGLVTWGILIANLSAFLSNRRKAENIENAVIEELHDDLLRIGELSRIELITFRGAINALVDSRLEEKQTTK